MWCPAPSARGESPQPCSPFGGSVALLAILRVARATPLQRLHFRLALACRSQEQRQVSRSTAGRLDNLNVGPVGERGFSMRGAILIPALAAFVSPRRSGVDSGRQALFGGLAAGIGGLEPLCFRAVGSLGDLVIAPPSARLTPSVLPPLRPSPRRRVKLHIAIPCAQTAMSKSIDSRPA